VSSHEDRRFAALNDRVARVIDALRDEHGVIHGDLAADALAFVFAVQIDLDPRISRPIDYRKAIDEHAAVIARYAKFLDAHFERNGIRFGELIGGEVTLHGELPPGHTRH